MMYVEHEMNYVAFDCNDVFAQEGVDQGSANMGEEDPWA